MTLDLCDEIDIWIRETFFSQFNKGRDMEEESKHMSMRGAHNVIIVNRLR